MSIIGAGSTEKDASDTIKTLLMRRVREGTANWERRAVKEGAANRPDSI